MMSSTGSSVRSGEPRVNGTELEPVVIPAWQLPGEAQLERVHRELNELCVWHNAKSARLYLEIASVGW